MKTQQQIEIESKQRVSDLIAKHKVFFAFGREQYEQAKTRLAVTDADICSFDCGVYVLKTEADAFIKGLNESSEIFDKEMAELKNSK